MDKISIIDIKISIPGSDSCSGIEPLYSSSGVIHSYKWPLPDTRSRDCYWKIDVGSYKAIRIAFMDVDLDDDFGCDKDKVKVKGEDSNLKEPYMDTISCKLINLM